MIHLLAQYPSFVASAAEDYSPALIAQFAYDLAKTYNAFYQELPIFSESEQEYLVLRLMLSTCTARVIQKAMGLLGIQVPERM